MTDSERIRSILGISRAEFSRRYHIPIRTLEDWDYGKKEPPVYVMELLERVVKEDIKNEHKEDIEYVASTYEEFCKTKKEREPTVAEILVKGYMEGYEMAMMESYVKKITKQ